MGKHMKSLSNCACKLPCGCVKGPLRSKLLLLMLKHKLMGLFDLLHGSTTLEGGF